MAFTAMTALAIGGAGLNFLGARKQAKEQKRALEDQAAQDLRNAEIARENARDVERVGRISISDAKVAAAQTISQAKASFVGRGVVINEAGTVPEAVVQDMVRAGEIDAIRLRDNIEMEKRRAIDQADSFEAQAGSTSRSAKGIRPGLAGITAGVGSLVNNYDLLR